AAIIESPCDSAITLHPARSPEQLVYRLGTGRQVAVPPLLADADADAEGAAQHVIDAGIGLVAAAGGGDDGRGHIAHIVHGTIELNRVGPGVGRAQVEISPR